MMSLIRNNPVMLILLGLLGAAFIWATDPKMGIATWLMDKSINPVDAIRQAMPGTWVGLVGSGFSVLIGLWLTVSRKT